MKRLKKINCFVIMISLVIIYLVCLTGCSSNVSNTEIKYNSSNMSGIKNMKIYMNEDKELKMNGTYSMKSGKATIYVKANNICDVLYSKNLTNGSNKKIDINIDDLKGYKNLVITLEAAKAKNIKIDLQSEQKLAKDEEIPKVKERNAKEAKKLC